MKHGVLFDNGIEKHSLDDFGLLLNPVSIPYPQVKTHTVELEMGDGEIDLTESMGRVFYKNRAFSISFDCKDSKRFDDSLDEITSFLHGQNMKVTFWNQPEYYYFGRLSVNEYTSDKGMGKISVDCNFMPYKFKQEETIVVEEISESKTVTYKNDRMIVTPTFKASSPINFTFKDKQYSLNTTETVFPDLEFTQGDNVIEYSGTGTVTVRYQEGNL